MKQEILRVSHQVNKSCVPTRSVSLINTVAGCQLIMLVIIFVNNQHSRMTVNLSTNQHHYWITSKWIIISNILDTYPFFLVKLPSRELTLLRPPHFPTGCFFSRAAVSLLPSVGCERRPRPPRTRPRPARSAGDGPLRPRCGLDVDGETDRDDDRRELLLLQYAGQVSHEVLQYCDIWQ